jgi:hypothetical protein
MPTIAVINGIRIVIRYNDHPPPHFHAMQGGAEMRVRIADLAIMSSNAPANMERTVVAWAAQHQAALALRWVCAQSAQPLGRIA